MAKVDETNNSFAAIFRDVPLGREMIGCLMIFSDGGTGHYGGPLVAC